jgi:hypothetical protein
MSELTVLETVSVALAVLVGWGLLALAVGTELQVLTTIMEADVAPPNRPTSANSAAPLSAPTTPPLNNLTQQADFAA